MSNTNIKNNTSNSNKTTTTKTIKRSSTQKQSKADKLLSSSIKNLRENLTDLSLDQFLKSTLETVMQIERDEYLEKLNNPSIDKGNGFYGRAFNNLSIVVPHRSAGTSPACTWVQKLNGNKCT